MPWWYIRLERYWNVRGVAVGLGPLVASDPIEVLSEKSMCRQFFALPGLSKRHNPTHAHGHATPTGCIYPNTQNTQIKE